MSCHAPVLQELSHHSLPRGRGSISVTAVISGGSTCFDANPGDEGIIILADVNLVG